LVQAAWRAAATLHVATTSSTPSNSTSRLMCAFMPASANWIGAIVGVERASKELVEARDPVGGRQRLIDRGHPGHDLGDAADWCLRQYRSEHAHVATIQGEFRRPRAITPSDRCRATGDGRPFTTSC
jgi:hypothetical protein